ncbi:hypothetical protein DFA_10127 [Cavenderia fasciculata]|uniref:Uncharacterized protein n=1 Tax=Cavenderia fasciculata TaxID=261658 RepID=F4Q9C4_CACFS|nr:uncharacterized protein DFA_10127 [Cavenderia fasciculata]EGG15293.1 hypothetical protein DFA_10127 [Cavenderia fasciculata]|eukprot:XP_004352013.1 hypothetical protein DFA_10127 [Cavenderia fasciculata]
MDGDKKNVSFKRIINNQYLRTKIFKYVEDIHDGILERHEIDHDTTKDVSLVVKIPQVTTLEEFIRINRIDLFIDHFDRVYDAMKQYSIGGKVDHNDIFKSILIRIFKNDHSDALDFILERLTFDHRTVMSALQLEKSMSIEMYQVLKKRNYHIIVNSNKKEEFVFIKSMIYCHIKSGDIAILMEYDIDCRLSLFMVAIETSNQEILRRIKDSFKSLEEFQDFYHVKNQTIERWATMDTLKLIEYKPPLSFEHHNQPSTEPSQFGNVDFLKYIYNIGRDDHAYLYQKPHLSVSLQYGQLDCALFLIESHYSDIKVSGTIDSTIMSLDLVRRLFESPTIQINNLDELLGSIVKANQPDTLAYALTFDMEMNSIYQLVIPSLRFEDATMTKMLLDRFTEIGPTQFSFLSDRFTAIQPQPLELLYAMGHSLRTTPQFLVMYPPEWDDTPLSSQIIQIVSYYQPIHETIPPWVIMTRYTQYDDNIELLKEAISHVQDNSTNETICILLEIACKNGLIKVVECIPSLYAWENGSTSIFQTAVDNQQYQVAYYLAETFIKTFAGKVDQSHLVNTPQLILVALNRVDDDRAFQTLWNIFKPFTTNSELVSNALGSLLKVNLANRHLTTNRLDRMIEQYGQFYNGCEKDEYQMKPLQLTYQSYRSNVNHILTKYLNSTKTTKFLELKQFDYSEYYRQNIKLCLIPPQPLLE